MERQRQSAAGRGNAGLKRHKRVPNPATLQDIFSESQTYELARAWGGGHDDSREETGKGAGAGDRPASTK